MGNFSGQSFPTLTYGTKFNKIQVEHMLPVATASNSGFEYRTLRFAYARRKWTIPGRNLTWQDKETLLQFYLQMGGTLKSFLWTDYEHNSVDTPYTLGTSTGAVPWLIPCLVPVAGLLHPLFHIDQMTLYNDGVPLGTPGAIVIQNGLPYVNYSLGAPVGTVVTISGPFSFAARFDMSAQYALANAASPANSAAIHSDIKLIEVFE